MGGDWQMAQRSCAEAWEAGRERDSEQSLLTYDWADQKERWRVLPTEGWPLSEVPDTAGASW